MHHSILAIIACERAWRLSIRSQSDDFAPKRVVRVGATSAPSPGVDRAWCTQRL